MIAPVMPADEKQRLADLRSLRILDTPPERRFDRLIELARRVFDVPIAYIAMVDEDRQWFKAKCGISADSTTRDISFCGHAILRDEPTFVADARRDDRFADNPLVVGEPYVRFYAGHPLRGPSGRNVGTFCMVDREPRVLDGPGRVTFSRLAELAQHELGMVELIEAQQALLTTQQELMRTQEQLAGELAEAASYVQSLLPKPLTSGDLRTDYRLIASSQLGGDVFGYHELGGGQFAMYLLDVCGHGVGPSLLAVSVMNALRTQSLAGADFTDPASVLEALGAAFPMSAHRKFFTIWYGVYDKGRGAIRCAAGGHHPAVLFPAGGRGNGSPAGPQLLGEPQLIVGIDPSVRYESQVYEAPAGSRLYLFSDGAFEVRDGSGEMLEMPGLVDVLASLQGGSDRVSRAVDAVAQRQSGQGFADDFSLLEAEFG